MEDDLKNLENDIEQHKYDSCYTDYSNDNPRPFYAIDDWIIWGSWWYGSFSVLVAFKDGNLIYPIDDE